MSRKFRVGHPRADVTRAYRKICHQRCEKCGRKCPTKHVYSHVLDCCGERVVHILSDRTLEPITIPEPMKWAYAAGPTRTRKKEAG